MTDRQNERQDNRNQQQRDFDSGYDEGYRRAIEDRYQRPSNEQNNSRGRSIFGIIASVLGIILVCMMAAALLFALFMGGIWLGALATPDMGDIPVAPVVPESGADGDITIVEGDSTVTVAGSGGTNVPVPGYGGVAVYVEPTSITVPTNGDLSGLSVSGGGVSVQRT